MSQRISAKISLAPAEARSCTWKVSFGSYARAEHAARRLRRQEDDETIRPYACRYCGKFHVGHRP